MLFIASCIPRMEFLPPLAQSTQTAHPRPGKGQDRLIMKLPETAKVRIPKRPLPGSGNWTNTPIKQTDRS